MKWKLFQFLIGSLEAISLSITLVDALFQFLIGSLEAAPMGCRCFWSAFQFLIGSLEARLLTMKASSLSASFNSS